MEYLTPQQIQKIKEIFSVYDFSNEGLVDDKELGTTLRILGVQATEAEIKDMVRTGDAVFELCIYNRVADRKSRPRWKRQA